jgi:hypothetical protein
MALVARKQPEVPHLPTRFVDIRYQVQLVQDNRAELAQLTLEVRPIAPVVAVVVLVTLVVAVAEAMMVVSALAAQVVVVVALFVAPALV